jgi:HlyD family secretion protein
MKRWLRRILLLAALAVALLLLRLTVLAPEPVPVRVHVVGTGRVESTVTNSRAGTVRVRRRAKLSPEIGGLVVSLPYSEGQRVRRGDALLRLDDQVHRAESEVARKDLLAATAERERACLSAELAARERERIRRLAEEAVASRDQLDQAATRAEADAAACQAAGAAVERAEAALARAQTLLEKTVLRAPFDGVVAEVTTELGEWVTPSPPALPIPPVIDMLDPRSIYVSAPMDEVDSARIARDQPVRVTVDSMPGRHFPGRVVRVAPYVLDVEAQNRTIEIEVEFDDAEIVSGLLPGTSADVELILETKENALRVPTSSLLEGQRVLVVDNGTLREREVEVGLRNWDFTEVLGGLAGGEEVVVSLDRPEVQAGARVVIEKLSGAP